MNGDMERFAARAEMQPIMRTFGGLALSSQGRAMVAQIREKWSQAAIAAIELEIGRSIAERGMDNTADLFDHAVQRAGGNEAKFMALFNIVMRYGTVVEKVQRRQVDPFAF
ncbi:hypothetical protein [Fodinicola acaciae]|uniref:hypothetical protein n=1 Tax=Fodinicola acaciae TaxID=2681555 RepID=UPI0013D68BFF|nr:hypothetical protein [Fodinicola acaciae]